MNTRRPRARRAAFLAAAVGLVLAFAADRAYVPNIETAMRERVRVRMAPYADGLRGAVQRRIGISVGLRAFADGRTSRTQLDSEFPPYARGAFEGTPGVRALQFIEDRHISMIEPRAGNEAAFGMDVANARFPGTLRDHERSLRAERPMVTGPVRLREGGVGLVLRQRLTPRPGFPEVAGVVLDGPTLVTEAGIPDARSALRLEVRILDDDSWLGGDPIGSAVRPESLVLAVETGRWVLLGAPAEGWDAAAYGWRSTFRAAIGGGVLLIAFFSFAVFGRLDRLRAEVETSGSALELALRAGRMGVWAYDIRNGSVRWSDVASSIIGVEAGRDADRLEHVFTLMSPEDGDRARAAFEATRDGARDGYVEEFRLDRPDGTVRWVLALAHLERDAAGRPENISGILSDVTERHGLEEQVRQAQRLESEGMLAGGVAHDFNNLLTAIGGFAELAQSRAAEVGGPAAAEIVADLQQVLVSARRGTNLTSQLLAFSRRSPSAPTRVDVSRALAELQPILARLFAGRVDVVPDLAPDLPPVRVELGQLTQVMLNLLVVARDAMPQGGTVIVRTYHVPASGPRLPAAPPGEWVCIEVRYPAEGEQGEGRSALPPETGPASGTDESGLSVAVVQRAIETTGGRFAIETSLTGGTVFRVCLPLWRERA